MKKTLFAIPLSLAASFAFAGAIATQQTVSINNDGGEAWTFTTISIQATGSDVGRPGAFFIGAVKDGQQILYLTRNGWKAYKGEAEALAYFPALSSGIYTYHPLTGGTPQPIPGILMSPGWRPQFFGITVEGRAGTTTVYGSQQEEFCALAGTGVIEVYAGYGALTPDKEKRINEVHSKQNPRLSAAHIANVYLVNDMSQNNKVWKLLSYSCVSPY